MGENANIRLNAMYTFWDCYADQPESLGPPAPLAFLCFRFPPPPRPLAGPGPPTDREINYAWPSSRVFDE